MLYHIIMLMNISEIGNCPWSVLRSKQFESVNVTILATLAGSVSSSDLFPAHIFYLQMFAPN